MTEYLVPAGQALYELIMGKLGAEYTAGKENTIRSNSLIWLKR